MYKSVYNDHQNLAGRLRSVVNEKSELKEGLRVRDEYIQRLESENASIRATRAGVRTAPTVINAPGGIPIVGNKGTVENPTVNNYGPVPRRLPAATKNELAQCLAKKTGMFSVTALSNNGEAYKYAEDWREVFLSAGWQDENKGLPIQVFMFGGGTYSGVRISVHDSSTVEGQFSVANGSPEQNATQCISARNDLPGGGNIIPFKDFKTGAVSIAVSYQPQQ